MISNPTRLWRFSTQHKQKLKKKTEMALKAVSSMFTNSTNPAALTSTKHHHQIQNIGISRRDFINVGLSVMPLVLSPPPPPSIAREVEVGSFLPPSPTDPNFVLFKATSKDTPALRAGIISTTPRISFFSHPFLSAFLLSFTYNSVLSLSMLCTALQFTLFHCCYCSYLYILSFQTALFK